MQALNETQIAYISASLRAWSKRSGLTQKDLEARTGVDQAQISRIMTGQFKRLQGNVVIICKYANIDPRTFAEPHSTEQEQEDGMLTARMVAQYVGIPEERVSHVRDLLDGIATLLRGRNFPDHGANSGNSNRNSR